MTMACSTCATSATYAAARRLLVLVLALALALVLGLLEQLELLVLLGLVLVQAVIV